MTNPWSQRAFRFLACCLGNDYVACITGNGPARVTGIMDNWMSLKTDSEKDTFKQEYNANHTSLRAWQTAVQMFQHAPVFIVSLHAASISPRDAFTTGDSPYSVKLRWMETTSGDGFTF